jgi:hypothetical protein
MVLPPDCIAVVVEPTALFRVPPSNPENENAVRTASNINRFMFDSLFVVE